MPKISQTTGRDDFPSKPSKQYRSGRTRELQRISDTPLGATSSCEFLSLLPYEMRVQIYKVLPQESRLQLRLTNRQIKIEVEQNTEFSLKIDDQRCRFYKKLLVLRINECHILSYTSSNAGLPKYPERLRRVILDGPLIPSNLYRLFGTCSKIEEVHFTHESLASWNLSRRGSGILQASLQNLNYLTTLSLQLIRRFGTGLLDQEGIINFFLETNFPQLRVFRLFYSLWGNWADLLLFLTRHTQIQSLDLQIGDKADEAITAVYLRSHPHAQILELIEMNYLLQIQLTNFQFRDDTLAIHPTANTIIKDLVLRQSHLVNFQFQSTEISLETLASLVTSNSSSLKKIIVSNLRIPVTIDLEAGIFILPILDVNLFAGCTKLTLLDLSNYAIPVHQQLTDEYRRNCEVIGMKQLPKSLERILFNGFKMRDCEVIEFSCHASNLIDFRLIEAGKLNFSTYATILINLIKNCSRLKHLNIYPLQGTDIGPITWNLEIQQLNQLYQRFMKTNYDPLDDLDGFEATVNDLDRDWVRKYMNA